jgi:hypothetical protein
MGALTCATILVFEAQSHNCLDQDNIIVIVLTFRTNPKPSCFLYAPRQPEWIGYHKEP